MSGRCSIEKCRAELETHSNGQGQVTTICPACERRRRGRCVECAGKVSGKSWRCDGCKLERKRAAYRLFHRRHLAERRARDRRRWRSLSPEKRARRLTRRRELRGRPGCREKDRQRKRDWYRTHLIWSYAYQRRYRAAHREEKRQKERERYYRLHPVRPDPKCRVCGDDIEWMPGTKGRPALRCRKHNPYMRGARRKAA